KGQEEENPTGRGLQLGPFPEMEWTNTQKYRYQDEDAPHDHTLPRLTHEVRGPELVHVSEKNLSQIENVHGYVLQSHISPLK
ncbi:unnamed protein product, partial [Bubo scandiacus]